MTQDTRPPLPIRPRSTPVTTEPDTQTVEFNGTAGADVLTVHRLSDGQPVCGATGELTEWQRRVTCADCLTSEERAERQRECARLRSQGKGFAHIARYCGYPSPEEAEADYQAFMRKGD